MPDETPDLGPLRLQAPDVGLETPVVDEHPMPDGRRLWRFRFGTEEKA